MKRINNCLVIEGGGQRYYKELDFLKGFSIIAIILRHLIGDYFGIEGTIFRKIALLGGAGIHVFFFCSGFGLYLSYLHRPLTFTDFIRRRFGKIYLPYIFIVVISFVVPFIYQSPDRVGALFSHIFLYKMFMPEYIASFGQQMWYISTVFQFYVIFIFLCKVKKRMSDKAFFVLSLAASVFWWIFIICIGKSGERVWNGFFLQYLWEFSFGMILANYLYKGNSIVISGEKIGITALVGIGLYGIMGTAGGIFSAVNDIPGFFGFTAAALFVYSFKWKRLNYFFIKTALFSYELYLIHILIFEIIYAFLPNSLIVRSIFGCAAFGISYITASFIRSLFNFLRDYKGGSFAGK